MSITYISLLPCHATVKGNGKVRDGIGGNQKEPDDPYFYDRVYSICVREGFEPKIAQEVNSFPEAMALVADGFAFAFAFTRECYERFRCSGVVFKRIEGQPLTVESAIVFRKGARSSVLPSIIAALQEKKKPAPVLTFRQKAAG